MGGPITHAARKKIEVPPCPKCGGALKVSHLERRERKPAFTCTACGWTSDLRLDRARRIIDRSERPPPP